MKKLILTAAALLAAGVAVHAEKFGYDAILRGEFAQKSVYGVRSMEDGEHYTAREGSRIARFDYRTGTRTGVIFESNNLSFSDYQLCCGEKKILLTANPRGIYRRSFTADYYMADIASGSVEELLPAVRGKRDLAITEQGDKVGFVSGNNLSVYTIDGSKCLFSTSDGKYNEIINGTTDWVYEEEFAFTKAWEFSPDGTKVAWLRFDESAVPEFTMMTFRGQLYPQPYTYKYPKAGEKNSVVELHVADLATGRTVKVDVGPEPDQYISRIGWTPSGELYFYRSNRMQNKFEVLLADAEGRSRAIYTETSPRYIERVESSTVTFLPDGDRFIVMNETAAGYMHLYLYSVQKGLLNPITSGEWEVTELVEVTKDKVYYVSTETSPLRRNLYSVKLNGKGKVRLTEGDGFYRIAPSKGMRYFISYFTNVTTPNVVRLHTADGKVIRPLEDNAALKAKIERMKVPVKEFFTFTNTFGTELNAYILKPADFDPAKKYPVMLTQYSGPGSQSAADKWSIGWEDVLVQEGYIVVCTDGRGTGYRGEEFKKCTYGDLGHKEAEDQIALGEYMARQPWVDKSRIGIYGWSFGGFMSLSCLLKGNDVFKMAIAVAPVTSWRFYDSIYTEVYNGLPQQNPAGYDDNSPINFADKLKGKLLLIHGSGDDNVHVQNSYEMIHALVRAGKQFDVMIYPDDNHSMLPFGRNSIYPRMIEYTLRNL